MIRKIAKNLCFFIIKNIKFFKPLYESRFNYPQYIPWKIFFYQKILRINSDIPWPVHPTSYINGVNNIKIGVGTFFGMNKELYAQAMDPIFIGDYTRVAAYTKFISANHDLFDHRKHTNKGGIKIGRYCWIGIGAIILPGVVLGDHVKVAAGAVVSKSFEEGYCVIAGNPAKIVKKLDKNLVVEYKHKYEYVGYKRKSELTSNDKFYYNN